MSLGWGVGGESKQSSLSLQPCICSLSLGFLFQGHLCLCLHLQLGVSYFKNRRWDPFWELKNLGTRKDWAGFLFVTVTLSRAYLGEEVGRGLEAPRDGHAVSEGP